MIISDPVTAIKFISDSYAKKLGGLGIYTIKDFLTYFPRAYTDSTEVSQIVDISTMPNFEQKYTLLVEIVTFDSIHLKSRKTLQKAICEDSSGTVECLWFNQPYLKNTLSPGKKVYITGKVKLQGKRIQFMTSDYELIVPGRENTHLARIAPEYRLTAGVSKKWFRNRAKSLIDIVERHDLAIPNELSDYLQEDNDIHKDITTLHFPLEWTSLGKSVKTLSEMELVNIHLKILDGLRQRKHPKSMTGKVSLEKYIQAFDSLLSFEPTDNQKNVIHEMNLAIESGTVLNDLVQGDVGSGKTLIAQFFSYALAKESFQTALLAPTTILAQQHYENFQRLFKGTGITVFLATSTTRAIRIKHADIIIGTTAVLARKNELISNLGLVIVDEQHRFGVAQREELLQPLMHFFKKGTVPHFINMTATPIPRTIAETFFSDIQVRAITVKPKGRKPIKSYMLPDKKRKDAYVWIREQIKSEKSQVYWICPLVEDSVSLEVASAKKSFELLKEVFPDLTIGLLHGKLKAQDKQSVMDAFVQGSIDILVATSVIEVGIDVSNATIMMVENAERFGLAQLHQIRGRVGRGEKQSYCFFFYDDLLPESSLDRLRFIAEHGDGLKVAQYDLQQRGPGEVYGTRQSGIPDLKIAKLNDLEMIKRTKDVAQELYQKGVRKIDLFS